MRLRPLGNKIQIIVVDGDGTRDLIAVRQVWEGMRVELLGPFPAQTLPADVLRQANGVLIVLGAECQSLQRLLDRLEAAQVPFLFVEEGSSDKCFTLQADKPDIEDMLEELALQGDTGIRH
jgi:hypothetical protein